MGKNRILLLNIIGAVLVIIGVVIKNTTEQLKIPNSPIGKILGVGLFVLGWIFVAYSTGISGSTGGNKKLIIAFCAAAGIVFSVMTMKKTMAQKKQMPSYLPMMFAGCWLLLGYTVGIERGNNLWNLHTTFGIVAAIMVLISMMGLLPWQRKNCIVDGPGMPLFVGAWVVFITGNALI